MLRSRCTCPNGPSEGSDREYSGCEAETGTFSRAFVRIEEVDPFVIAIAGSNCISVEQDVCITHISQGQLGIPVEAVIGESTAIIFGYWY
jgi:hypothetical protein